MPTALRRPLFLLALLTVAACHRTPATTTVILVRHAERPPGTDPDLNAAGRARAESLAVSLARSNVSAILHTQFKRAQQTAAPLATRLGVVAEVVAATGTEAQHAQAVVQRVQGLVGQTILYVGHSNTVPAVIQALGIAPPPAIADTEYQHFFVVTRVGNGPATLVRVRYGQ
ncbi:MAG: histidine phosphatase family protein [Gemmatimonadaceae bacterium]|nr:histidine phosphatase family protein [Gemmatimonadaceae bacterium]